MAFQVGPFQTNYQQVGGAAVVRGGGGSVSVRKRWWRVGNDLIFGTEQQALLLATPDRVAFVKPERKALRPKVEPVDVPLIEVPEYRAEIVLPNLYREVPLLFDSSMLMRAIQRRLEELDEEDIEFLILH